MKRTLLIAASLGLIGIVAFANSWWGKYESQAVTLALVADSLATRDAGQEATSRLRTGLISAGGDQPLLARTSGRVKSVFFMGGEYVHQGDILAKLVNYSFVIAPRSGFLGQSQIVEGQYLTPTTLVTTISRRSHLVVALDSLPDSQESYRPGDSVRVWVPTRPTRVVTGVVAPKSPTGTGTPSVEVLLGPGAPFRLGERARVQLRPTRPVAVAE
ncbi:hypothetical protein IC235_13215 [Hymenobacter sp. BT664]|uniref:HlyD family efflux transporter periplasmic adaptor subunit n=1 Tax=Hymenobacter montanus TaxID=2771359 RepID=A0A927GK62_9BACT|nr:hypothetical protein [Hymenobacter montanus]MBD2768849.1 hypothetical protein [Hymenobacter montanus]